MTEQLVGHLGGSVVRAHLEGDERGISAGLVVEREGRELLLPCHPADALALAVRARAPIMAQDSSLALARPAPPPAPSTDPAPEPAPGPTEDVQGWLDRVRPGDFEDDAAR